MPKIGENLGKTAGGVLRPQFRSEERWCGQPRRVSRPCCGGVRQLADGVVAIVVFRAVLANDLGALVGVVHGDGKRGQYAGIRAAHKAGELPDETDLELMRKLGLALKKDPFATFFPCAPSPRAPAAPE